MPVVNVDTLLRPLADDAPCGENLRWDRRFLEIERLAEGKEANPFEKDSLPEEPDWREVRDGCMELLARGKHLRIIMLLTLAATRLEGYTGFRDGVKVVHGLITGNWDQVFPQLDPEDNNDPTERINSLALLSTPIGTYGDKLKLLDRLQESPLADSRVSGRVSLRDIAVSAGTMPLVATVPGEEPRKFSAQEIEGAFSETDPERLQEIMTAIEESSACIDGIEEAFSTHCGSGIGPEFSAVRTLLKDAGAQVRRRLAESGVIDPSSLPDGLEEGQITESGVEGDGGGYSGRGRGGGGDGLSGEVRNREEVIVALDKICRYYETQEPSSPVPVIVKCAREMVSRNFLDIVTVLTPDAVETLKRIGTPPEQMS